MGDDRVVDRGLLAALAGSAAASAAYAESAEDLRAGPGLAWRWVVHTDALDLYAVNPTDDRERTGRARPDGGAGENERENEREDEREYDRRVTLIGGGGALHRARVALAADGFDSRVTILPDADPNHLATLVAVGPIEVTDEARARYQATDRGGPRVPVRGRHEVPPAAEELANDLVMAAMAEGVGISVREEDGDLIAVLYGPDTGEAWLRAGEAVSAVRLEAARHGRDAVPTVAGRERPRDPGVEPRPTTVDDRRRSRDTVPYAHLHIGPVPT